MSRKDIYPPSFDNNKKSKIEKIFTLIGTSMFLVITFLFPKMAKASNKVNPSKEIKTEWAARSRNNKTNNTNKKEEENLNDPNEKEYSDLIPDTSLTESLRKYLEANHGFRPSHRDKKQESIDEFRSFLLEELLTQESIQVAFKTTWGKISHDYESRILRAVAAAVIYPPRVNVDAPRLNSVAFKNGDQNIVIPDFYQDTLERLTAIENEVKKSNEKDFGFYFYSILTDIISALLIYAFSLSILKLKGEKPEIENRKLGDSLASNNHKAWYFPQYVDGIQQMIYFIPEEFKLLIIEALFFENRQGSRNEEVQLIYPQRGNVEYIKDEILLRLSRLNNLVHTSQQEMSYEMKLREFNNIINDLRSLIKGIEWTNV